MKYLSGLVIGTILMVASPALAVTAHGVVLKGMKVASYPVRHPVKTAKAPVKALVVVAKHV